MLTPNLRGYQAARAARADTVAVFASASEGFSRANLNASIAESLTRMAPVAAQAQADGVTLRGYVSVVTDCPFDGPVAPAAVARVAAALRDMGCQQISLGDTIGQGRPRPSTPCWPPCWRNCPPTAGRALPRHRRAGAAECGCQPGARLRVFDAAVGGLGGCPMRRVPRQCRDRGAARHLDARGFAHGLDMEIITRAAAMARALREAPDA